LGCILINVPIFLKGGKLALRNCTSIHNAVFPLRLKTVYLVENISCTIFCSRSEDNIFVTKLILFRIYHGLSSVPGLILDVEDLVARELLLWFKNQFFQWVSTYRTFPITPHSSMRGKLCGRGKMNGRKA